MKNWFLACLLAVLPLGATAAPMDYLVEVDTCGKYLNVSLLYVPRPGENDVLLKMPVWAPGYYEILDFPKHLSDFRATTPSGRPLAWEKRRKNGWLVRAEGDTLLVRYRIYANSQNVAECRVERRLAFMAPNGVFLYADGRKDQGARVAFCLPTDWKNVSTGMACDSAATISPLLNPAGRKTSLVYAAADVDELYDCPFLLGNHDVEVFWHEGRRFELAMENSEGLHQGPFLRDMRRVVSAATQMMGHIPYDKYCFILLAGSPKMGLEHRNSQVCTTGQTFHPDGHGFLMNLLTHEYFHLYNVKDIRPLELGPFDYDQEVYTPMLWVSEGLTVYYVGQLLMRAQVLDFEGFAGYLSHWFASVETQEGRRHQSLRQNSLDIWLVEQNEDDNAADVTISFYSKGSIVGLLLDIEIRALTQGRRSLDDVMRRLYNRYYLGFQRGFTEEEFWQACADVAGQPLPRIRRYVETTDEIDYDACLAQAGLALDRATFRLVRLPDPTPAQRRVRKGLLGE